GHRRPGPRRHLFWRRRRRGAGRRPAEEQGAILHAGAQEPRPDGAGPHHAAARSEAVGENRATVSANGCFEQPVQRPGKGRACRGPVAAHDGRRGGAVTGCPTDHCAEPGAAPQPSLSLPPSPPMKRPITSFMPDPPAPPRRKRLLSEEERRLWESVAGQTKPLRKKPRIPKPSPTSAHPEPAAESAAPPKQLPPAKRTRQPGLEPSSPPLVPIGR